MKIQSQAHAEVMAALATLDGDLGAAFGANYSHNPAYLYNGFLLLDVRAATDQALARRLYAQRVPPDEERPLPDDVSFEAHLKFDHWERESIVPTFLWQIPAEEPAPSEAGEEPEPAPEPPRFVQWSDDDGFARAVSNAECTALLFRMLGPVQVCPLHEGSLYFWKGGKPVALLMGMRRREPEYARDRTDLAGEMSLAEPGKPRYTPVWPPLPPYPTEPTVERVNAWGEQAVAETMAAVGGLRVPGTWREDWSVMTHAGPLRLHWIPVRDRADLKSGYFWIYAQFDMPRWAGASVGATGKWNPSGATPQGAVESLRRGLDHRALAPGDRGYLLDLLRPVRHYARMEDPYKHVRQEDGRWRVRGPGGVFIEGSTTSLLQARNTAARLNDTDAAVAYVERIVKGTPIPRPTRRRGR